MTAPTKKSAEERAQERAALRDEYYSLVFGRDAWLQHKADCRRLREKLIARRQKRTDIAK